MERARGATGGGVRQDQVFKYVYMVQILSKVDVPCDFHTNNGEQMSMEGSTIAFKFYVKGILKILLALKLEYTVHTR